MTFLALAAALLLEQARALSPTHPVYTQFHRFLLFIERRLDAGSYRQGILAWALATLPVVLVVAAIALWLHRTVPLLGLLFDIGVLYLTMGFRVFSRSYRETHDALRAGDLLQARASIGRWRGGPTEELSANEVARLAIERGLACAHRHVFGVIAWFAVFGAAGAVFYRLAALVRDRWGARSDTELDRFGRFSREVFHWCNWIPARFTAIAFAVTGDFEDALYCWRTQANAWPERSEGIVLAAGAGAIGVRLGSVVGTPAPLEGRPAPLEGRPAPLEVRPELGTGEDADAELMTSAVGLIWRALVLWLVVIALVTVASWFGSAGA
ncbi:MAG: CobD/CbiB family protein [Betaproteobacteria bacterium]|nr:CobD/CbiB family protein [Betaproteobacteria bacterium]